MADDSLDFELLWTLLAIDGPSGDESALADWLMACGPLHAPGARWERLGDSVLAVRGESPQVAVFAHIDTTGWTLGYEKALIPIGGPSPRRADQIRPVGGDGQGNRLKPRDDNGWRVNGRTPAPPGSRWVYAARPERKGAEIVAPYLDNRCGVWAALQVLARCPRVAAAFTVGEEHSGQGAFVCARRLYESFGITQALISDLTWHTAHVRCGKGVAVSLRDRSLPRQRFLDQVLRLAERSGLPFQREIEAGGGSDGASIDRSGVPIDWAFVGAPEKKPHTGRERVHMRDLRGMADMLTFLVDGLSASGPGAA